MRPGEAMLPRTVVHCRRRQLGTPGHARVFLSEIKYDVNKVAVSSSLCFAV